ncbi:hypothetical protein ACFL3D_01835 [Candidatus Omnitrophota bacterium]
MQAIIEQIKTLYANMVAEETAQKNRDVVLTNREAVLEDKRVEFENRVAAFEAREETISELSKSIDIIQAAKVEQEKTKELLNELDAKEVAFVEKTLSTQKALTKREDELRDKQNMLDNDYKNLRAEQATLERKKETYKNDIIKSMVEN